MTLMDKIIEYISKLPFRHFFLIVIFGFFFMFICLVVIYFAAAPGTEIKYIWGIGFTKPKDEKPGPIYYCCQVMAADSIMRSLIESEGVAVVKKDFSIIKNIFDANAEINEAGKKPEHWPNPDARYDSLLKYTSYKVAINYAIRREKINENEATYTSASYGLYKNVTSKVWEPYDKMPGANEWVFRKDATGNWKIIRFTFNKN